MKKARRKSNLDEDKIQAQKDKGVTMLRRFGDDDAADKLDAESLESYAARKGIRINNPQKHGRISDKEVLRIRREARRKEKGRPTTAGYRRGISGAPQYKRANRHVPMSYALAHAAGEDAANRQMRKAGRSKWSRADYNLAARTMNRLLDAMERNPKRKAKTPEPRMVKLPAGVWDYWAEYRKKHPLKPVANRKRNTQSEDQKLAELLRKYRGVAPPTSSKKPPKNWKAYEDAKRNAHPNLHISEALNQLQLAEESREAGAKLKADLYKAHKRLLKAAYAQAAVDRASKKKRNAFGLDRFFGRKSRVTSSDWNRAGEARRAQALRAAGVSKKLLPVYTDMSWRDMQSLEPSFITKVMASLPARKNARRTKPRKAAARKRPRIRKNTSGTALAKKIRELMRDNGLSRSEATKAATRILRASHTKPGEYKRSRRHERRNPDALDRAGQTYAMFHGRGPKEVVKVNELTGGPKTVTALGDLLYFVVVPDGDASAAYKVAWGAGDKRPFLASNSKATQLYIVGGNQDVDEMLRKMGVTSSAQDLLDLGEVREVEYYTQKDFDNFTPIRYFHHFGEEDAKRNPRGRVRRPRLIYSRSNKKLMLAGGAYKIKKDGIIN